MATVGDEEGVQLDAGIAMAGIAVKPIQRHPASDCKIKQEHLKPSQQHAKENRRQKTKQNETGHTYWRPMTTQNAEPKHKIFLFPAQSYPGSGVHSGKFEFAIDFL